ncbi:methyl-accepting chemotaxis protein [Pseudohoeflea suaedae]|uniref:Methyl-accepting chemotaxis protein n=1 Tax=Pseudohoeflea suaedae TaxID=877384 RepID=A0A4R5PM36_9HYPH|nr:methyl-accepting chemotaxis protein [Pseudohoeflea suaedae]TDH37939.1 methyl-accepting chemotaxis protein [Pseudohoeflea suaedae]
MPKSAKRSVATKLILVTGLTITLLLVVSNVFMIFQTTDRVRGLVIEQAQSEARAISQDIAAQVGELSSAARTMAGVIEHTHASGFLQREGTIDILRANLEQNPFAFGSWMAEAPRAFDGRQEETAGNKALGSNEEGFFSPYWSKDRNGAIQFGTFKMDYEAEWFTLAASSRAGAITKPYVAEGTDVPTVMSSIVYPIESGGKLIGVSGVDISLASLSEKLTAIRPFETGRVMLVSQDSKWLVGPDTSFMMKPYEAGQTDPVIRALSDGTAGEAGDIENAQGEAVDRIVYPFDLPGVNARWVVLVDVPESAISAQVNAQTKLMIAGGLAVLLAALAVLYLASRRLLQRPLGAMLESVDNLGLGDYETPVSGQNRNDEIGALAVALEGFRHKLADGVRLERVAEDQRQLTEEERRKAETERASSLAVQQRVVASLAEGLAELSHGNLTYRLSGDFPGEYGKLKNDFNSAIASLEETIVTLSTSADMIGTGSNEISDSASDLSQRTERQAASLEETAAALDELTSQINASAENARQAARSVSTADADTAQSGDIVRKAITAMTGIEQSSQEVNRIIGVIDEIAFQTNLLALNAGVEAARAGEAGKGFAVVAQEVRELAQRSATAAKEIKQLINTSTTQVIEGVDLVGQTGSALESIAAQVRQINVTIQEISSSAAEQAVGLKEINAAVNEMDHVTQQNAAMVEQATAASQSLSNEARSLLALVSRFTTSGQSASPEAEPVRRTAEPARAPQPAVSTAPSRVPQVSGNTALATAGWEEF